MNQPMKVTAIIQARMTSTRLPGKVLMEVMGRPLLSYQIERLQFSKRIADIIIATTVNKEDDPIAALARTEGVSIFRGSEDDVLDRYYQAGKLYSAQNIMRLTADCPLLDANICDLIALRYLETNVEYIATGPSFAEGLDCEVFRLSALERSWKEVRLKSEQEHVTPYIRNHPEIFQSMNLENETDDSRYRMTVDTEEDFLVVKAILENLYRGKGQYFTIADIKSFLDMHPEIYKLSAHIIRNEGLLKSLQEDSYN